MVGDMQLMKRGYGHLDVPSVRNFGRQGSLGASPFEKLQRWENFVVVASLYSSWASKGEPLMSGGLVRASVGT